MKFHNIYQKWRFGIVLSLSSGLKTGCVQYREALNGVSAHRRSFPGCHGSVRERRGDKRAPTVPALHAQNGHVKEKKSAPLVQKILYVDVQGLGYFDQHIDRRDNPLAFNVIEVAA
jgi:hypothetical protein